MPSKVNISQEIFGGFAELQSSGYLNLRIWLQSHCQMSPLTPWCDGLRAMGCPSTLVICTCVFTPAGVAQELRARLLRTFTQSLCLLHPHIPPRASVALAQPVLARVQVNPELQTRLEWRQISCLKSNLNKNYI